jgi:hypothetical protein
LKIRAAGVDLRKAAQSAAAPAPWLPWRLPSLIRSEHRTDPAAVLDLTDFKRDLSELTDRLGNAQDCL